MQVYTDTHTITADTIPSSAHQSMSQSYIGYRDTGSTVYGSVNTPMKINGYDVTCLAISQGFYSVILEVDGSPGDSGFWRIKVFNTYLYRHDAKIVTQVNGKTNWTWYPIQDPLFTAGQTSDIEIEYHQEIVGEVLIDQGNTSSRYGFHGISDPGGTCGVISGTIEDMYVGATILSLHSRYINTSSQLLELIVSGSQPNYGWDTMMVDTIHLRREDANYSTYTDSYYGNTVTKWQWDDLVKSPITTSSSLSGASGKDIFVNFYTMDRDLQNMKNSETELWSSMIEPLYVHMGQFAVGQQVFEYAWDNIYTTQTRIKRNDNGCGFSTTRFGLQNERLDRISWNPGTKELLFRFFQPTGTGGLSLKDQLVEWVRMGDNTFYTEEATRQKVGDLVTYTWQVGTNPWYSPYYPQEVGMHVPVEVGNYDKNVYIDGYVYDNAASLSHSVSLKKHEPMRIFFRPSDTYDTGSDPINSQKPTITGLPTGANIYGYGDWTSILIDFQDVANGTYNMTVTLPFGASNYTVSIEVTVGNSQSILAQQPATQVAFLTTDSQGNILVENPLLELRPSATIDNKDLRIYIRTDLTVPQSLRREIYRNTNDTHAVDASTLDNLSFNSSHLTSFNNSGVLTLNKSDLALNTAESGFIRINHSYFVGGVVQYTFSTDFRLKFSVNNALLWGAAMRNPSGVLRLTSDGRVPRVDRVLTGTQTGTSNAVVLSNAGFNNTDYKVVQVFPDSKWAAFINSSGNVEVTEATEGANNSSYFYSFLQTGQYAILVFKL